MSERNDGGPAFPGEQGHTPEGTWNQTFEPGMSLRDYFAANAMQGLLTEAAVNLDMSHEEVALWAYGIADAMLAQRDK